MNTAKEASQTKKKGLPLFGASLYGLLLLVAGLGLYLWQAQRETALLAATLPAGDGRELVIAHCSGCHSASIVAKVPRRTHAGWGKTILWMEKMQGMPPLAPATAEAVNAYLSAHFGLPAARQGTND